MTAYAKAAAALVLLVLGFASGWWLGASRIEGKWNASKAAMAQAQNAAIIQRAAENLAQTRQQAAQAAAVKKVYNEEINDVRARLAATERMRRPAFCASAGPAAPAGTGGAAGSAAADPTSRLLPDAVARNIQALILQTEEVAATGRACQAFVRANVGQ
ncbi:hypothetical protein CLU93_4457 [Janthinobacterium sp. 35]|uniref:hypothetical protein n=1 Tax=Janthinobacterium sp. 35 TaxID=2035210 RepID=UPI000C19E8D0|nr:hypothetical protein [Janthinobacterium sp. 35]PIG30122.1 hypothetical protein CLU93_4457 [Janthinobacterium sp. 35]